jgi:hypothetical protein
MPDNKPTGFANPEKHNADVAQKLLKQDLVNLPAETGLAGDALDKLASDASKKAGSELPPGAHAPPEPEPPTPEEIEATEKAEADAKAAAAAADPAAAEAQKKADEAAKAKAASENAERETADKLFKDSPGLPPGSSPKASEAFSSIKIKAAQEISAREAELEKLRKEKSELEEKLKNPVPPELESELKEHRTWRAKLDVDFDPKFKVFDKTVTEAQDFIYSQLSKSPAITPEIIAEIKRYGGPENVNLNKIFAAVQDPTMQRLVESKVADIEMAKFQKEQAVKTAKDNITKYVEDRQKQIAASFNSHTVATQQRLDPMVKALDWFVEKPVDPKADEPARKVAEDHNAFVKQTREQLDAALKDDSAEMRAILLVGMAQLFQLQRTHSATASKLEAAEKALKETTEKWEKVKNASRSRSHESAAPSGGTPQIKPKDSFTTHAGDALDSIAKQVMEARAAKAAA